MGPQAKRRKLTSAIEEITFDPVARHEFLTGFHKRKMARMRHAQEVAEKKAREERRQERKKVCLFSRQVKYSLCHTRSNFICRYARNEQQSSSASWRRTESG